jgi:acetoacetate decarboxylase
MLKGFSVPLTPQGQSVLAALPRHYSSDCIAIEYWADPAALLPPGPTMDEKSGGRAFFWFLDWQFTGSNDELTNPARYQYREAFALVEAVSDGRPVNYCPYIYVDNDAAIARGWARGFPKKLGSVYQTRSFSRAQPRRGAACQGQPFRRERRGARGTAGDRPDPAREEDREPHDSVQSSDHDAPVLSAAHGGPS